MGTGARFLLISAVLLTLPAITATQPSTLLVQRVWTQDAGGNEKTTFAPGETIQLAARLKNLYGKTIPSAELKIRTTFYNDTKTVDIPAGVSTWTWKTTAPSEQGYTVTIQAYDRVSGVLAVGSRGFNVRESASSLREDRYAPSQFDIPDTIGKYSVLAVLTEDNFPCTTHGKQRLILQSPEPTIEDGPRGFPKELIDKELKTPKLIESSKWESTVVGPGVTREQLVSELEKSYHYYKTHGCPSPNLSSINSAQLAALTPIGDKNCSFITGSKSTGGEFRCDHPGRGFALIQNLGPDTYPNNNGQSVILIAPTVGNNQKLWFSKCDWSKCDWSKWPPCPAVCTFDGGYSVFLNNAVIDKNYFLQVGLHFTNRPSLSDPLHNPPLSDCLDLPIPDPGNPFSPNGIGTVTFAGAKIEEGKIVDLRGHALCVPYVSGHHYYTTIAYTSGTWWTCAADMQDPTTYRCREHPQATELGSTHLIKNTHTNVWVENMNKNEAWTQGFPAQWVAYGAKIYVNGIGHPWPSELKFTEHSCKQNNWPPQEAIVESSGLANDREAFFNTAYIPLYCD